jgi:hypothetical protein
VNDDGVGTRQVDSHTTGARGNKKHADASVRVELIDDGLAGGRERRT